MTALQSIIKEAKAIRKKSPKMEWKKAVAQASAIYASKHKGKSPVGKKKAKKSVGKVDKKLKKGLASKGLKMPHGYDVVKRKRKISGVRKTDTKRKPTEKAVLKSIKHAVSVQKSHMSGIGKFATIKDEAIHRLIKANKELDTYKKGFEIWKTYPLAERKKHKANVDKAKKYMSELKKHIAELKKHI
jgi:hypothetical protein